MTREWVLAWASHYSYQEDTRIFGEIGLNARRRGWYERQEFLDVVRWKTKGRGIGRAQRNQADFVMAATQMGFLAAHPAVAVAALTSLAGVQVPVASALLTASYPDRYTVTDFRSQESIVDWGGNRSYSTLRDYVGYIDTCCEQASRLGVTMRQLDRALWAYSKWPDRRREPLGMPMTEGAAASESYGDAPWIWPRRDCSSAQEEAFLAQASSAEQQAYEVWRNCYPRGN